MVKSWFVAFVLTDVKIIKNVTFSALFFFAQSSLTIFFLCVFVWYVSDVGMFIGDHPFCHHVTLYLTPRLTNSDENIQLSRLCRRSGESLDLCRLRISAQWSLSYKTTLASHVIDNSGRMETTEQQVEELVLKQKLFSECRVRSKWLAILLLPTILTCIYLLWR